MMQLNEIKKALYKQKPVARFMSATKRGLVYSSVINEPKYVVKFLIPLSDIGDAIFLDPMNAQLLIRYIVLTDEELKCQL